MRSARLIPSVVRPVSTAVLIGLCFALPADAERPEPNPPTPFAERLAAWEKHQELDRESLFRGLEWRNVGPVVQGGRVVDIAAVPGEPYSFYVAYASGGLWKTENNGVTFEPLFDHMPTIIMADIAVDPSHPETLWVGTGENNASRSSYSGLGVYRSDDGGATWRHVGLGEGDRIGRILIDPRDSDRVMVGVSGRLYTTGGTKGVYRTTDGGAKWQQVLAPENDTTGVIDMVLDPSDPDIVYASTWDRFRRPWNFREGGPGSGVWKSTDGGTSWLRLGGGLPRGAHVGRIGLALAASQTNTLYAALDNQEELPEEDWDLGDGAVTAKRLRGMSKEDFLAQDPEEIESFIRGNDLDTELDAAKLVELVRNDEVLVSDLLDELDDANANLFNTDIRGLEIYRSDDGGESWRRTHDEPLRQVVFTYGYYFGQIRVDPTRPDRIYVVGVPLIVSDDGGKTFESALGRDVHVDFHDVWIDPSFPDRVIVGNDGGLDASYDGGETWVKLDAQPVGQFYTVEVDMDEPYNIYGGLQDNGVLKGSSRSRPAIDRWRRVGGGDGMYVQVDTRDDTVYWGYQFGFYFRDRDPVRPRDKLGEPALRYNWATPVLLSEHHRDVLYFGANQLYRSLDRGDTWTAISDDLTSSEERGDVPFGTLTTLAESPERFGLLWAGTDDGHVHVTDDGGVEWREASDGLPRDRWVTRVEASHHTFERAFVSLSGYRDDDMTPYLYVTEDLGRTWTSIAAGLPAEPINTVREDPVSADVLYVGTDRGVYVSLDRGQTWQALPSGMANVPVHDVIVHPRDRELVAATHGRSIYVLDALPIQDLTAEVQEQPVHVFPLSEVEFERSWRGRRYRWFFDEGDAPKITVPFWTAAAGPANLTVRDDEDRVLRRLEIEAESGVNTFIWDLLLDEELALAAESARLAADEEADDGGRKRRKKKAERSAAEPPAEGERAQQPWSEAVRLERPLYITPGSYSVRVEAGGGSATTELVVEPPEAREPRAKKTPPIRGRKE